MQSLQSLFNDVKTLQPVVHGAIRSWKQYFEKSRRNCTYQQPSIVGQICNSPRIFDLVVEDVLKFITKYAGMLEGIYAHTGGLAGFIRNELVSVDKFIKVLGYFKEWIPKSYRPLLVSIEERLIGCGVGQNELEVLNILNKLRTPNKKEKEILTDLKAECNSARLLRLNDFNI